MPLRVQVFARGSASPAFQLGFTSLSFGMPGRVQLHLHPAAGREGQDRQGPGHAAGRPQGRSAGLGALGVGRAGAACRAGPAIVCQRPKLGQMAATLNGKLRPAGRAGPQPAAAARQLRASMIAHLPKTMTGAQRREAVRSIERSSRRARRPAGARPASASPARRPPASRRRLGSGWTSVRARLLGADPGVGRRAAAADREDRGRGWRVPAADEYAGRGRIAPGSAAPARRWRCCARCCRRATPVHGSWGSGRLLRTTLLTVLITSKGRSWPARSPRPCCTRTRPAG